MDFLTPFWNTIIIDPMTNSLLFLYMLVRNYGLAIILFTVVVGLITMPLRIKSQSAMKAQQAKQARIQPKLDELKKKYKNDQQAYQQAQMKLMQEEGLINPLNSGCLLTLLPFPIFIGLYSVITAVLGTTPESLLSLSQHLYPFFPQAGALVPVNPNFLGLNLAAIPSSSYGLLSPITILIVLLVVGSSWIQQKIMTPATASVDPQQAAMQNQMQLITPLIFGFFVVNAPVGLSVYWITFGLMTIVQQLITGGTSSVTNMFKRGPAEKKAPPRRPKVPVQVTDEEDEDRARPRRKLPVQVTEGEDDGSAGAFPVTSAGPSNAAGENANGGGRTTAAAGTKKGKKKRAKK